MRGSLRREISGAELAAENFAGVCIVIVELR
jgi:hypothetical protein